MENYTNGTFILRKLITSEIARGEFSGSIGQNIEAFNHKFIEKIIDSGLLVNQDPSVFKSHQVTGTRIGYSAIINLSDKDYFIISFPQDYPFNFGALTLLAQEFSKHAITEVKLIPCLDGFNHLEFNLISNKIANEILAIDQFWSYWTEHSSWKNPSTPKKIFRKASVNNEHIIRAKGIEDLVKNNYYCNTSFVHGKECTGPVLYVGDSKLSRKRNLEEAVARGVNLTGANLTADNLNGAYLKGANLRWASFTGANLRNSNFQDSKLSRADMTMLDSMFHSEIRCTDFTGADLSRSQLDYTKSYLTEFNSCIFDEANVSNSIFNHCYFKNVNLSKSNFQKSTIYDDRHIDESINISSIWNRLKLKRSEKLSINEARSLFIKSNSSEPTDPIAIFDKESKFNRTIEFFKYNDHQIIIIMNGYTFSLVEFKEVCTAKEQYTLYDYDRNNEYKNYNLELISDYLLGEFL